MWRARVSISPAARRVKVSSRIRSAGTPRSIRYATRQASVRVLPVPEPATTSSGPSPYVTASRWAGLSSSSHEPDISGLPSGGPLLPAILGPLTLTSVPDSGTNMVGVRPFPHLRRQAEALPRERRTPPPPAPITTPRRSRRARAKAQRPAHAGTDHSGLAALLIGVPHSGQTAEASL